MIDRKTHWENVYAKSSHLRVSWYQEEPALSLQLIRRTQISLDAPIIDVGGGASLLVDRLCDAGYSNLAVLDVSAQALAHAKDRLGNKVRTGTVREGSLGCKVRTGTVREGSLGCKADKVEWFEADVTQFNPPHRFSLWHDRAVFHFLTDQADRDQYVGVLNQALKPGGHLIIMAFAIGGPEKCSGLDIVQYDADKLSAELGPGFELVETGHEIHHTPAGKQQKFAYFRFVKIAHKMSEFHAVNTLS